MHSILAFFLFPRACDFPRPSLVKFAPIYSKNRSSPTTLPNTHTNSPRRHSLRSLLFFLFLCFPLIRTLAAHHELAHTHSTQTQCCCTVCKVRLERVHQSRRARSKHKQGQNLTDELQRRRPSSRESPIKLNTGWCCPMKCCRNGPFH